MREYVDLDELAGWPEQDPELIYEIDVLADEPGPWVECEMGDRYCIGGDYAVWMKYHEGWMCWSCYRTAEADHLT